MTLTASRIVMMTMLAMMPSVDDTADDVYGVDDKNDVDKSANGDYICGQWCRPTRR